VQFASSTCILGGNLSEETFRAMRAAGIETVEIVYHPRFAEPQMRRSLAAWITAAGLKVQSLHARFGYVSISALDEKVRAVSLAELLCELEFMCALGGGCFVVHSGGLVLHEEKRPEHFRLCRESLNILADACAARGVRLALEFLPRSCLGNTCDELLQLIEGIDHGTLGVCLDTNHANIGRDLTEATRALAGKIVAIHVSDNDGLVERHWFPYQGVIDWSAFTEAINASGFDGPCMYEVVCDPKAGIPDRLDFLARTHRRMWGNGSSGGENG
jgi:sugar phosphate isomerase/epimerase